MRIHPVIEANTDAAVALLARFFVEEGFATPATRIAENLARMVADPTCWAALAVIDGAAIGVITVTTMLYVEWGRLGEIGDLYVMPAARGRGAARMLIAEAMDWCRQRGCSAVSVVITSEAEEKHGLSRFYARLKFATTGRSIMSAMLD